VDIARLVASLIDDRARAFRFGDPAFGSGSFLSAALAVFGPERIREAVGVELDAAYHKAARELWPASILELAHGDFTRIVANSSCPRSPNLILANPPYVRHHHIDRPDKERLRQLAHTMTGVKVSGLAGLYVYFLLLATAWMEDGGYAAWLVPSEFMDVNYGAALKRYLTDQVTLIRVHRFAPADAQFGDAMVSSAILVFRKAPSRRSHAVEFTFGGTLTEPIARDRVTIEELRSTRKWSAIPSHDSNDRRPLSAGNGPTLSDFFRIQRGVATGSNKFFVVDRADARRLGLPARFLRPILPSPRLLKSTVVEGDDDGYPRIEQQLCLIDCDLPEHTVRREHPALWEYLSSATALGIMDGYLVRKRSPWYRQERRPPAPFLCTYMGRGTNDKQPFRFILNHSKAIGTNLYLMLYPLNTLEEMLRRHPQRIAEVHEILGGVTGQELRGEGRVYGGGLNKIEPRELGRVSAAPLIERWPELRSIVDRQAQVELFR
jgi:hypothetical protein